MKNYTALIIEDDIENIMLLKIYLSQYYPMIDVVAEAINVNIGVTEYLKTKPDLLLLDIDLGDDDVFSFIDSIGKIDDEIVFISSHSEYGVKAVNYNVTGFIEKPIDIKEFKKIINKAIFNIEAKKNATNEFSNYNSKVAYPKMIAIPSIKKVNLIAVNTIEYIEADGKYTIFHQTNKEEKIASRNLGEYEKILDPKIFFRIHHRYLVNTNRIANIHKTDGNYCELINGKTIPIAKRRLEDFNKFLRLK